MIQKQKSRKKVDFISSSQGTISNKIVSLIQAQFQKHNYLIADQYILTQRNIEDDSSEFISLKSLKSFRKEVDTVLDSLQKMLIIQLTDVIDAILKDVFEEENGEIKKIGMECLTILHSLLIADTITDANSSKIAKWIYDLLCFDLILLTKQFQKVCLNIKGKLIKLGASILKQLGKKEEKQVRISTENEFKASFEKLVKNKEKQILTLRYQLCRVCQSYFPLATITAHVYQCQREHQALQIQSKLQQKGTQLLTKISSSQPNSQERFYLRQFFERIYNSIGDVLATFSLKNNLKEIANIISQYKGNEETQQYGQILSLLSRYQQLLESQVGFGDNHSDTDSKAFRSKRKIKFRHMGSNTSLLPQEQSVSSDDGQEIFSQKTIHTDTDGLSRNVSPKLQDFQIISSIGKGSYSEVFLVRKKNTKDLFAMKVIQMGNMDLERITAFKQQQKIYKSITGGFNVKLYYSFGVNNLYFLILDYGCGGSLSQLLERQVYFEERYAKVYLANLILAVNSIHKMGIIHRDLKPDNIVINQEGLLILTDFNLSKLIKDKDEARPNTFFGTPDYIAPQVLKGEQVSQMIDYFSVGVIAYEMVIGVTPFTSNTPQQVFQAILQGDIQWPDVGYQEGQISFQCKDLLEKLLEPDPSKRLGSRGLEELQNHPFFQGINWSKISQEQFFYIPPLPPYHKENEELTNYITNKMRLDSEGGVSDVVVRYDILKTMTNKNVRSHRNSRFKLEKELQALKMLPSFKLKKHNSYNNLRNSSNDSIGISCKDFYQEGIQNMEPQPQPSP